MTLIAAAVTALIINIALAEDFCSIDNFPQPSVPRNVHFSKELSEQEFAVVGNFMSLHCCARYFRTIEWFKDNQSHPWPGHVSSLVINPDSLNQTIYSPRVDLKDTGRYHCLVSNGSHVVLKHEVQLTVSDAFKSVEPPKATYRPKDTYLRVGETARFYCEAYVGNIQLPDARSEIVWSKENSPNISDSNISQRIIFREGKRVLGAILTIENVQLDNLGQYTCKVSNAADQFLQLTANLYLVKDGELLGHSLRLDLAISFVALSTMILLVTIYRFRLQCQMLGRSLRRRINSTESSEVDVTVLYHERDSTTALSVIVPTLQYKFQYSCTYREIQPNVPLSSKEVSSRRLFVIFTPAIAGGVWTPKSIADAIQQFLGMHSKVICLFLQDLPQIDIKTEEGRRLKDSLSRVHYITYLEAQDKNFWTIVQLGLPLQKPRTRQSRESLEQLM